MPTIKIIIQDITQTNPVIPITNPPVGVQQVDNTFFHLLPLTIWIYLSKAEIVCIKHYHCLEPAI